MMGIFQTDKQVRIWGSPIFCLRWTHFLKFFVVCVVSLGFQTPSTEREEVIGSLKPTQKTFHLSRYDWKTSFHRSVFLLGTTSFAHVFLWISCESTPNATPIHANLGSVVRGIFFGTMMGFRNPDHKALLPLTTLKTNMSPKNRWLEDVFPTEMVTF